MSLKILGRLEEHAFFVLFMSVILIMLWHGIWGLADNLEQYLHERYEVKKLYYNIATVFAVVLVIGLYPQILDRL